MSFHLVFGNDDGSGRDRSPSPSLLDSSAGQADGSKTESARLMSTSSHVHKVAMSSPAIDNTSRVAHHS